MMVLLHDLFAEELKVPCSVLYSDVGDFYKKCQRRHALESRRVGWEIRDAREVVWRVGDAGVERWLGKDATAEGSSSGSERVAEIREDDFERICAKDAELLRRQVADSGTTASTTTSTKTTTFTALPTADQIAWAQIRAKFYQEVGAVPQARKEAGVQLPGHWGYEVAGGADGHGSGEEWGFVLWTYSFPKSALTILRLRCCSQRQLRVLLGRVWEVAKEQGMDKVTAWNVDENLLERTGWRNVEREDSLPALAWYGDGEGGAKGVEWICNEHWAWC